MEACGAESGDLLKARKGCGAGSGDLPQARKSYPASRNGRGGDKEGLPGIEER